MRCRIHGGKRVFRHQRCCRHRLSYASLENEDPDTWEEYPDNYKGLTFGFHPIKQSEKIPVGLSAGVSWGVVGYPEDAFETNYYARSIGAMISRNWPVADRFAFLTTGGILNSGKVKHGEVFLPLSVEWIVNPSGQFKLVLDLTMLPIAPCDRMGYSMGLSLIGMTAPRKTGPKTL